MLLEIAIAVSVIGVISAMFITRTNISRKIAKIKTTHDNIETVTIALAAYLAENSRLPCPSLKNDGLEGAGGQDLSNYIGTVPFHKIGLGERDVLDGDGRRLVYVVEPGLTLSFNSIYDVDNNPFQTTDYFCKEIIDPSIQMNRANVPLGQMDVVAFVVDTADNCPVVSGNRINVKIFNYTRWLLRDFLLMKYLKNCPCHRENPPSSTSLI
ncbi:MAG: hypothetical protein LBJ16_01890 [Holosporaceae bacterium]|nr:hypothetical protein [Holosporaceae bacterium]